MVFLAKGKRGKVYLKGGIATKKSQPFRVMNEVYWLKILNKHKIGPTLVSYTENSFSYQFVKGEEILKWAEKANKKSIIKVLKAVIKQCEAMDILMVNKKEMNHPYKHILISNDKPVMIDFERCKLTSNPKNVNQFFQFLINSKMSSLLKEKGIIMDKKEVQALLKEYKKTRNKKTLNKLLSFLN
ncbi:hypothetical protein J4426_03025 [Candidatus Woesearchaeota archaeon]|nr:hypothetical protein [Candidatus Woesearchaeota archaeon]